MVGEMRGRFRRWLTRPPRPHGATIVNRRVSFLELFYDLVYVAVIGQTGHQLAEHISVRGVVEFAIAWIGALLVLGRSGTGMSLAATHSLVERFGLFTIIVLGEVVFGVVEGLVSAERDSPTVGVGLLALCIGFGFWWIYFDLVGRRLPRSDGGALTNWIVSHFPIALSIAAAGAAIVSLIEHAHDVSAPASTAWLLAGAVALGLLALIVIEQALADAERLFSVYRPLSLVLAIGAVAALAVGWVRPAPWLLALLLVVVLSVLWVFAVLRFLSADAWGDAPAAVD
jgi:low temperature requirement protein LtrA